MSKKYDAAWENALTVVQEVQPPFIPDNAHVMTVVVNYPPGNVGAPPHRHASGPAFGYLLQARCSLNWKGSRRVSSAREKRSGNPAAMSFITRTATTEMTSIAVSS